MNFLCYKEVRGLNYCFQYFFQGKESPWAPALWRTRGWSHRTQLSCPRGPVTSPPSASLHAVPARTSPRLVPHPPRTVAVLPQRPQHRHPGHRQQHSPLRHRARCGSFPWVSSWRRSTTQMGMSTCKNSRSVTRLPVHAARLQNRCLFRRLLRRSPSPSTQGCEPLEPLLPLASRPHKLGMLQVKFFHVTCNSRRLFRQRCCV